MPDRTDEQVLQEIIAQYTPGISKKKERRKNNKKEKKRNANYTY